MKETERRGKKGNKEKQLRSRIRHRSKKTKKMCNSISDFISRVAAAVLSFSANSYYLGLPRVKLFLAILQFLLWKIPIPSLVAYFLCLGIYGIYFFILNFKEYPQIETCKNLFKFLSSQNMVVCMNRCFFSAAISICLRLLLCSPFQIKLFFIQEKRIIPMFDSFVRYQGYLSSFQLLLIPSRSRNRLPLIWLFHNVVNFLPFPQFSGHLGGHIKGY